MSDDPAYASPDADWTVDRIPYDDWDISEETARQVYERVINDISEAVGESRDPDVVIVGEPQYRALWVYAVEIHSSAERPEQLVPGKVIVVPGPMLYVPDRNIDLLFD